MPGHKPHSVSTDLSLGRGLLRAIALKMADWSNAILNKLASDDPAGSPDSAVGTIADARRFAMDNGSAGRVVSKGPPKHWIERVRQGAPELLRPPPASDKRPPTPAPEASAIAPPAGQAKVSPGQTDAISASKPTGPTPRELRLERPADPSEEKEADKRIVPPPARPMRSASATQSIRSIESRESSVWIPTNATQAKPAFATGARHEQETPPGPDPTELLSSSPQSVQRIRLAKFPTEHSRTPSTILSGTGVPSKAAPHSAPADTQGRQEPSEDPWPELPQLPPDALTDPKSYLREQERLRRLDDEQRGIYGARRIPA
jgi:hypothetical protein